MSWKRRSTDDAAAVVKTMNYTLADGKMTDAATAGRNTSDGFAAPNCARYIMMVIGIKVSPEALMHKNITMELLADSLFGFNSCNCCMAFNPIGVAALSSPSKFADRFMKIEPVTGWSLGISGKSLLNTGAANRANACITRRAPCRRPHLAGGFSARSRTRRGGRACRVPRRGDAQ